MQNAALVRGCRQKCKSERNLSAKLASKDKKAGHNVGVRVPIRLAIYCRVLQRYCACHEEVQPRYTKSCKGHAKWSLKIGVSRTQNLQPFHRVTVQEIKHHPRRTWNPCGRPLRIHQGCHRFCNPHELRCLPCILQRVETLRTPRKMQFEPPKTASS